MSTQVKECQISTCPPGTEETTPALSLDELIENFKRDPYETFRIATPHTGHVSFAVSDGSRVLGPSGKWLERPGSVLYNITRQGNRKPVTAPTNGSVAELASELEGRFVAAGTHLMTIRHPMTRDEVINRVLREVLHVFRAPEKAKYFFTPELAAKMEKEGDGQKVLVRPGEELLIMSRMKRDTPVVYDGSPGIIYACYFKPNVSVQADEPLLGVCPPERLDYVCRLIQRINVEWESSPPAA